MGYCSKVSSLFYKGRNVHWRPTGSHCVDLKGLACRTVKATPQGLDFRGERSGH